MRTRSNRERRANTRYAGEEWVGDVEMFDADVDRTEVDRCVADEMSDPNVAPPVAPPEGPVDERRRAVRSKKTHTRVSLNKTTDQNAQADDQYPEEYLSSIKDGRLPAHVLRLKIGAPIIALRNITKGVSNGTRMVVTRLLRNSIFARVLHGPKKGQEVAITKVFTTHNMGAFQLERRQLPIRVAFAMTINKAQGLTLRRVGVHVEEHVFSHGQLYVAFSRCGDPDNLWVFGPEPDEHGAVWIKNVVFIEVLIDDKEPVDT